MPASTRTTRSSTTTVTPTNSKTRAGATAKSPYFDKTRSQANEELDAVEGEAEESDGDDAPKRRLGRGVMKMMMKTRKEKKEKEKKTMMKKAPAKRKRKGSVSDDSEEDNASDVLDDESESDSASKDEYEHEDEDEDEDEHKHEEVKVKARQRGKRSPAKKAASSPRKRRRTTKAKGAAAADDEFDVDVGDENLKDGQEVVGVVVQAPKTGRVPPGQISRNTLDFLAKLKDPKCNDREWFKLHEPVYRAAETEWKAFVEAFTDVLVGIDAQVPHLPPKDVIHRIYRDVRFSNDKTPYKKGLSASFSRSGRKGIFAGFKPGNESIIAAGSWCPARNELATIRSNIQRNPRRLRRVLANPDFVRFFGAPRPHPKGERQSIFGMDDELKVAPKGVAKDNKDIDLLKCRSFAVSHKFTDSEVLSPDFKEILGSVARVMQPLVHCLNDMMTIMPDEEAGSGDDAEESNEDEGEGEGEEDEDPED